MASWDAPIIVVCGTQVFDILCFIRFLSTTSRIKCTSSSCASPIPCNFYRCFQHKFICFYRKVERNAGGKTAKKQLWQMRPSYCKAKQNRILANNSTARNWLLSSYFEWWPLPWCWWLGRVFSLCNAANTSSFNFSWATRTLRFTATKLSWAFCFRTQNLPSGYRSVLSGELVLSTGHSITLWKHNSSLLVLATDYFIIIWKQRSNHYKLALYL